jgi:hypothetical protein
MSTALSDVLLDLSGGKVVAPMAGWTHSHQPAATAQATIVKGAGAAGVKHVCTGVIASIACGATPQTPLTVQLLDNAAVLLTAQLAAPANGAAVLQLTNLFLVGTAATSMTLQFTAGGVANSVENVTMLGFDIA